MDQLPRPAELGGELSCDREPIHNIGAIQSFGFLLSFNADWFVVRASKNVAAFLGFEHQQILGRAAERLLPYQVLHDIRGSLQFSSESGIVGRLFGRKLGIAGPAYDIAAHRSGREFVLEFEESIGSVGGGSLSDLRSMIAGVERQTSATALMREAARHIRAFTGFDRVMVYSFDDDGSGEVVAEAAKSGMSPFLGLHFPASDIPVQARALYERCYLRSIVDVDAVSSPVLPELSSEGEPLDLSMSSLRSVSQIHIEYLKNMGVRSSMSISVLRGGRLWGLIACHHGTPKHLDFEMRSTAELFGQMFSYLLEEHEREDESIADSLAQEIHDRASSTFASPGSIIANTSGFLASLTDYIPADGAGVFASGKIALTGHTPDREEFRRLIGDLNKTISGTVFATHKIGEVFPNSADYATNLPGVLAIPVSRSPHAYVVFFRQELIIKVLWAGDPASAKIANATGTRLMPRTSFRAWQQIVHGQSTPWTKREFRLADVLRRTLVELALGTSDAAHADRTRVGQRQEILIAELNHRNRNILGLVRGLITQSAASASDVEALVESLDDRLRSLASAHDILTSGNWKPSSLHDLVRAEISTYSQSETSLQLIGPDVLLQPQAYSAMAMVVHELVTNARKHGALTGPKGTVRFESSHHANNDVALSWREIGGPPVVSPTRRGFGSTILEQAIPFEVGGVSTPRYRSEGFELDLLLPAAVASCVANVHLQKTVSLTSRGSDDAIAYRDLLRTTLVVEDNLFIAIDAEDMLRRLGAGTTEIVKTVSDALDALANRSFSFALLDVNLGVETSLPVALALKAREIPFVFGTGYGDALGMPTTLKNVPIIAKPYSRQALREIIMSLVPLPATSTPMPPVALAAVSNSARIAILSQEVAFPNTSCFTRKLIKLAPISIDDKTGLASLAIDDHFIACNTDIVSAGDRPDGLYIVLDGFACRYNLLADGSRQITSYLIPGDFCDFSSQSGKLTDALGTISPCKITQVSRDHLTKVMRLHPAIAYAFRQSALVDQAVSREWLVNLGHRSAEKRLAHLFCEVLTRMQDAGFARVNECTFPLTQYDLCDTAGLSLVHMNRTLQSLRQRGLITLKGKVLVVLDFLSLASLAGFESSYLYNEHPVQTKNVNAKIHASMPRSQDDL